MRRRLLGEITRQPNHVRLAKLEMSESSVEVSIDDLSPGDVILISAGEQIPVDGRVFKGHGLVDEQVIRGVHGLSRKGPRTQCLAGQQFDLASCRSRWSSKDTRRRRPASHGPSWQ